jgi:uncharacterized protein with HEPN domain
MYDKEIVIDLLQNMIDATQKIQHRNRNIQSIDDYLRDDAGMMLLDSLCMQLIAIGEAVKKIDKETGKMLLHAHTSIPWREIAGMRDILSHHYFDLNAEVVFEVTTEQIPNLQAVLLEILKEVHAVS